MPSVSIGERITYSLTQFIIESHEIATMSFQRLVSRQLLKSNTRLVQGNGMAISRLQNSLAPSTQSLNKNLACYSTVNKKYTKAQKGVAGDKGTSGGSGGSGGGRGRMPTVPAILAVMSLVFSAFYMFKDSDKNKEMAKVQKDELEQEKEELIAMLKEQDKLEKESKDKTVSDKDGADTEGYVPGKIVSERFSQKEIDEFPFDKKTVVFVLGGPGSGKGTNSAYLVRDYGFVHLSAGDLLRAEQKREGSKVGELIAHYIKEGQIVPYEVTIGLLRDAMMDHKESDKFLIDGFPRSMEQKVAFENGVTNCKFVLYFECIEPILVERIMNRAKTSGRSDDNIDSLKKRFKVFQNESYPVVAEYLKYNKVCTVNCNDSVDKVYSNTKECLEKFK
ncbi:Uridylate kinase [Zancudomyces culisetae]|uniref:Uridylate kinase n=1 Tax=Zancudomyces culisetae TaxID=1213189 RepID=A0A1R1PHR7_ZANCU|nr:Uridylate kinase [Zancudomyces culisetae]OMH83646.1 Uridylate kinase [Zancudomyces culisetae]|eukprot:OMH80506.1 Uridylate kinase [Zancudomyces culisetae]